MNDFNDFCHGRNEGMWDQRSNGWDLGSQLRDQGSQTMGSGSVVFEGSVNTLYHFCGTRDQNLSYLWNRGSEIWVQKMGSAIEKHRPGYDPDAISKVPGC